MPQKTIVDEQSLRDYFSAKHFATGQMSSADVDSFLEESQFEGGELVSWKYIDLMIKLSIEEFLEFLDAAGVPRESFTVSARGIGCGKNYVKKGACNSSDGYYCSCR
jgi:hypothetical protein